MNMADRQGPSLLLCDDQSLDGPSMLVLACAPGQEAMEPLLHLWHVVALLTYLVNSWPRSHQEQRPGQDSGLQRLSQGKSQEKADLAFLRPPLNHLLPHFAPSLLV